MRRLPFLTILLLSAVLAAPAPWSIAINNETGECGSYWMGDEFSSMALPEGWEAYYPDYNEGSSIITTEYGECEFDRMQAKACCEQMGLEFTEGNVGESVTTTRDYIELFGFIIPLMLSLVFVPLGIIAILYFKFIKKTPVPFHKKGFVIGAALGVALFILLMNTLLRVTFGSGLELLALTLAANVISYGTLGCLAGLVWKRFRGRAAPRNSGSPGP